MDLPCIRGVIKILQVVHGHVAIVIFREHVVPDLTGKRQSEEEVLKWGLVDWIGLLELLMERLESLLW